jgi:hypothetical protein
MPRTPRLRHAAAAAAVLGALIAPQPRTTAAGPTTDFPLGWYDGISNVGNLPEIVREGMTTTMPYVGTTSWGVARYLDSAKASGVKVLLEIPRPLVKKMDVPGVRAFVSAFKSHSALRAWYLADEPSLSQSLGPLSPSNAKVLYQAIKAEDAGHPVAIAFSSREDPRPYLPATDVVMHDHYPFYAPSAEFKGLDRWTFKTFWTGAQAKQNGKPFYPVIQAFGGTNEEPELGLRAPTAAEERYMIYSALQAGANGLFFWTFYRSDPQWVNSVLLPLIAELQPMKPALASGEVTGLVTSSRSDVRATVFRDPATGRWYLIATHNAAGAVEAPLTLAGALAGKTKATLVGTSSDVPITNGRLNQVLDPYGVKAYRID